MLRFIRNSLILLALLFSACGEKMILPTVVSSPDSFGANDTSYIHLYPDWTASSMGYFPANPMKPVDIALGDDGFIFVADQNNDRVIALSKSGEMLTLQGLDNIKSVNNPVGIDIDSKLNLLIVNGTNKIYAWNQFINISGVKAIAIDTTESGRLDFKVDPILIDSVMRIHPIYIDEDENSSFQGVTFGVTEENTVFVTDNRTNSNRILKLNLVISAAVDIGNRPFPLFKAEFDENIAEGGSGAGTVDDPRSITCDNFGNIYFTQFGGNFLVQKLKLLSNGSFSAAYTLYEDPIMDLNRFISPRDLALGQDDAIFVLDTGDDGKVSKFVNKGTNAGQQANLGKRGLSEARFLNPMGISISDEEIVYITNTDNGTIERYQHSISDDDIPQVPL
jgi:hypothetical protein